MKKLIFCVMTVALVGAFMSCDGKSTTEKVENDSTAVDSVQLVDSLVVDSVAVDSTVVLD